MLKKISVVAVLVTALSASWCVARENTLYLDVYESGKLSGAKIKANLRLTKIQGALLIIWDHIYITPLPKQKNVALRIEHFGPENGTIKNIRLHADHTATFEIVAGPYTTDPSLERKMTLWLKLSEDDSSAIAVSGSMVFWDSFLNGQVSVEWKQTETSGFKLPYNTVI